MQALRAGDSIVCSGCTFSDHQLQNRITEVPCQASIRSLATGAAIDSWSGGGKPHDCPGMSGVCAAFSVPAVKIAQKTTNKSELLPEENPTESRKKTRNSPVRADPINSIDIALLCKAMLLRHRYIQSLLRLPGGSNHRCDRHKARIACRSIVQGRMMARPWIVFLSLFRLYKGLA